MFSFSALSTGLKLKPAETIWLETEQFEQLRLSCLVDPALNEAEQWQQYLQAIALCGFEQWLQKRASSHVIDRTQCLNQVGAVYNLKVNEFKLNLIVKEQVLDEIAEIPTAAIEQLDRAAHFYVLLEVSEEQQQVKIRGFLRYDRLRDYCTHLNHGLQNGHYQIPLAVFDPEPNHLLFYCDFLEPAAMPLPASSTVPVAPPETISAPVSIPFESTQIQLRQWLQGVFAEGWQAIDDLFSPQDRLAWSARNLSQGAKRGKLLDLGMQLQEHKTVLLVNVTEAAEQELSVLVQLHPAGKTRYLPSQITLTLLSQAGEKLQEVRSRNQDNYIQLKSFKGQFGIPFKIGVSLGDICLYENFEL
ncbi:MAG: DUF1822 family protein [Aphanocapsa sp. GSE-SYN-MK-11-07L]|jgi:hypothetical protein|nr:DUF1822 family protein [Aphanocapsa sp. GSE-SYN-MK-11-07L]